MLFFRETNFFIKTKQPQSRNTLGFFVRLKVTIQGKVNPESGMIMNLKDLDLVLCRVKKNFPIMKSKSHAFLSLYQQMESLLGDYFFQLEMSWDQHAIVKNKSETYRVLKTFMWFQEVNALVKRKVSIKYRSNGHRLLHDIKSIHRDAKIESLKSLKKKSNSGISEVCVEYSEKLGWMWI